MKPGEGRAQIPGVAKILGYGGVLPFAAMALNQIMGGPLPTDFALKVFLYYSAAILSFLGGIRWGGMTRMEDGLARELIVSVTPSLWAVFCLLLDDATRSVWLLQAGFVMMGVADFYWPGPGLAEWMRHLRLRLTVAVVICHLLVAASFHW